MRIMIVDNDEAWTRSLTILLTGRGYEVRAFTNPTKACEFIRRTADNALHGKSELPDSVVLDYIMPGMSGFQVLKQIGDDLRPSCRIVIVTGHGEQLRNAKLNQIGVTTCLEKPVDLDTLEQALDGGMDATNATGGHQ